MRFRGGGIEKKPRFCCAAGVVDRALGFGRMVSSEEDEASIDIAVHGKMDGDLLRKHVNVDLEIHPSQAIRHSTAESCFNVSTFVCKHKHKT